MRYPARSTTRLRAALAQIARYLPSLASRNAGATFLDYATRRTDHTLIEATT